MGSGPSLVSQILGGVLESTTVCPSCGYTTQRCDAFRHLSLELHKTTCTLLEALQHFTAPEHLDCNNRFECEKCGGHVGAQRQLLVAQAPLFLVLHLKRRPLDGCRA